MAAATLHISDSISEIQAGFIPLTDCAPLVIARELGFDTLQGLHITLHREASWANIRDKIEVGALDCAITLAPMPLASTLGLGGRPAVPVLAVMATSLNGNAITLSRALHEDMLREDPVNAVRGGMETAKALARVVARRQETGLEPLTLGMVYPFSCHNYDLRYWLAAAGIDPINDVNLVVVPPPLIAASLMSGRIDGFCVGEPWGSVAVAEGGGVIVATKSQLWAASPEKVLGVRRTFADAEPEAVLKLIRALSAACTWLDDAANHAEAAKILARPQFVGIDHTIILRALNDSLDLGYQSAQNPPRDVLIFGRNGANLPRLSHATWLLTQMIRWGQVRMPFDIADVARAVYRPYVYAAAIGRDLPANDLRHREIEDGAAFFGGDTFDCNAPIAYLRNLALRDPSIDLSLFPDDVR